eukprot:TRINITY_DN31843_c0_g1_i1.p1 TRINITY_DN31843_c0_g1~~TRINITY_DN31843_c0_g1_i1.p1  ORF type:complete len:769 (-),score=168.69 TRINITY_DN31843_c0_g1_i1:47-2353(-)
MGNAASEETLDESADIGEQASYASRHEEEHNPRAVAERYQRLHSVVSQLLNDEEALARQCECLLPPDSAARNRRRFKGGEDSCILPDELQGVTQVLIDRLGCRHPATLERVSAVYSTFVGRVEGLTLVEFQGYVACVLTQILRELEGRCMAAGLPVKLSQERAVAMSSAPPEPACPTPFSATLGASRQSAKVTPPEPASKAVPEPPPKELSEIERLTQELSCLNNSLSQRVSYFDEPTDLQDVVPEVQGDPQLQHKEMSSTSPLQPAPASHFTTGSREGLSEIAMLAQELDALNTSLGAVPVQSQKTPQVQVSSQAHFASQAQESPPREPPLQRSSPALESVFPSVMQPTSSSPWQDAHQPQQYHQRVQNPGEKQRDWSQNEPQASPELLHGQRLNQQLYEQQQQLQHLQQLQLQKQQEAQGHHGHHIAPNFEGNDEVPSDAVVDKGNTYAKSLRMQATDAQPQQLPPHTMQQQQAYAAWMQQQGYQQPQVSGHAQPSHFHQQQQQDPAELQQMALQHHRQLLQLQQQAMQQGAMQQDAGVEGGAHGVQPRASGQEDASADPELHGMPSSWLHSRLQGAGDGLTSTWKAFAETMDSIFVPEAPAGGHESSPAQEAASTEQTPPPSMPRHVEAPPQDVPLMFRQPTCEEVHELLEQEGLPAYVAVAQGRAFSPKKICMDMSDCPSLYVLEPDSSVPAVFFGMTGFSVADLRRIVVGTPTHPSVKPLISLEFEQGFLPLRLGDARVLRGLVGVLCQGRNDVQIFQRPDWS